MPPPMLHEALREGKKLTAARRISLPIKPLSAIASIAIFTLAMRVTSTGDYFENVLFRQPLARLKAWVGFQPTLDQRIRLIIADDRSLDEMGRAPTLNEWVHIAAKLRAMGYRQVIYPGPILDPPSEALPETGPVISVGVVNYPAAGRSTFVTADLPARLVVRGATTDDSIAASQYLLGIRPSILPVITQIGSINAASETTMPIAFASPSHAALVPSLPLLAAADPSRIPRSVDGLLSVDFVSISSVVKASVKVSNLFEPGASSVTLRPSLDEKTSEILRGGEVALLIHDGRTGSRLVESPVDGKVPAYAATASLMTSVISNDLLSKPFHFEIYLLATGVALVAVTLSRSRRALLALILLLLAQIAVGVWGLEVKRWIFPCAEATMVTLVAFTWRLLAQYHANAVGKARLDAELELGRKVQSLCLPTTREATVGAWDLRLIYTPHGPMAGDWMQCHVDEGSKVGPSGIVAIGDVVGKGASAALATAVIATTWETTVASESEGPSESAAAILNRLHAAINKTFRGEQSSSVSIACIERETIMLASVGAPRWISYAPGGEAVIVRTARVNPVGAYEATDYAKAILAIEPKPGQFFVAFTDGVIDGGAATRRFTEALQRASLPTNFDDATNLILVLALKAGAFDAIPDDQTMLIIRYRGKREA